ncbi:MAG: hypothetical protein GMKNLPBB_00165 [Myxococcota bacterium]|nr:hypothetical protein [Myxococcota bacterium]
MDNELIRRAQSGDKAAMEQVVAGLMPVVYRYGMLLCRNPDDADDIVQDTLFSVTRHLKEFEGRSALSSWVFLLARTACNRKRRGLKNRPALDADSIPEPASGDPTPEDQAELGEAVSRLRAALESLDDDQREVLVLRDVEGLTAPETAAALGISVEAVKSRLHRARAALKDAFMPLVESPAGDGQCPDAVQMMSRKLEGELTPMDCAEMEKHVESCPRCKTACDSLKSALLACKSAGGAAAPPQLQRRVRKAVARWLAAPGVTPST